jgi:hypothetical protein
VRCFISHAAQDRALAEAIANYLQRTVPNFTFFLASVPGQIPADAQWFTTIQNELRRPDSYLVIITPISTARPWIWFEAGAGWMTDRPLYVTIAGGIRKQDVPPPLGFFQISDLEDAREVSALIGQLGGRPEDGQGFCAQVQRLARQAVETTALQQGWEGVQLEGRYYAWEGPNLDELAEHRPIPIPPNLERALIEKGLIPSYGLKRFLAQQLAHGRKQVFDTDRIRWKREILYPVDPDQVLFVRRGIR